MSRGLNNSINYTRPFHRSSISSTIVFSFGAISVNLDLAFLAQPRSQSDLPIIRLRSRSDLSRIRSILRSDLSRVWLRLRCDLCRLFDLLFTPSERNQISVGLMYLGWSNRDPAYAWISSTSLSTIAPNTNVFHSLYLIDPTDTYTGDRGIMSSVIHKANRTPVFSPRSLLATFVSCKNMIFPGPAITVATHDTSRLTQSLDYGGLTPILTSVDLPAGILIC